MNEACIFCKIVKKEISANVIFENENIICFLDIEPINEGHVLIIPKRHYLDVDELPDEIACEIMRVSQRILKALRECYAFPGYSIMQNGGRFNDIGHYHMHIFPRYEQDGFGWTFGEIELSSCNKDVSDRIRNVLRIV